MTYSKINTAILALLLILAIVVLYMTTKDRINSDEEIYPVMMEDQTTPALGVSTDTTSR